MLPTRTTNRRNFDNTYKIPDPTGAKILWRLGVLRLLPLQARAVVLLEDVPGGHGPLVGPRGLRSCPPLCYPTVCRHPEKRRRSQARIRARSEPCHAGDPSLCMLPGTETIANQGSRALLIEQTCGGPFSAVLQPISAITYSFCKIFQAQICRCLPYLATIRSP